MPKVGEITPEWLAARNEIRSRIPPPSGGPDPDLYTMKFKGGEIKFRKGVSDPWTSVWEFNNEITIRDTIWYPNIHKGDVVVDVGAGWGAYALTAAALGATVHAFEPDMRIMKDLEVNVKENGFNCVLNPYGLGAVAASFNWEELQNMYVIPLDQYGLRQLDFLKIDVEGQEMDVIKGAQATIKAFRPKILVEVHLAFDPNMLAKLDEYILKLVDGYELKTAYINENKDIAYAFFASRPIVEIRPELRIQRREVGKLNIGELEEREQIRQRPIPGSGGPDPDIYSIKFMEGYTHKFRASKFDPWNSWYAFHCEVPIRERFWYPYIHPGDVVLDVGASWGLYAITAAVLGATVHAFEPDYRIFADLKANVEINGLKNVILHPEGLSDTDHYMDWDEIKNMHLVTLDSLHLEHCDFIKIDVEGQEFEVLKGAQETIRKFAPKILLEAHLQYDEKMLNNCAALIMSTRSGYQLVSLIDTKNNFTVTGFFYNDCNTKFELPKDLNTPSIPITFGNAT